MGEVWKAIPGYEGQYEVSDQGRVRSLDRVIQKTTGPARYKGRILREHVRKQGGYRQVALANAGVVETRLVHELVALAFLGPRPDGQWVAHNTGDPDRNGESDLRYDTPSANQMDKLAHGTLQHGESHHNARLTAEQVRQIRAEYSPGRKQALADRYAVNPNHIYRIAAGKRWAHV